MRQRRQMMLLLCGRDEKDGDFRYAPGKWSAERSSGTCVRYGTHFRLSGACASLAPIRTPLESFEQDDYVRKARSRNRPLSDLVEDFIAVRRASLSLLRNLDEAAWMRRGVANKNEVTVRALTYHDCRARTASSQDSRREIFRVASRAIQRCISAKSCHQRALTELLRGKGAHADPIACVEDVSAELAGCRLRISSLHRADSVSHELLDGL